MLFLLIDAFNDPSRAVTNAAVASARELSMDVMPIIAEAIESHDAAFRANAYMALGHVIGMGNHSSLERALQKQQVDIIELLKRGLEDPDQGVRDSCQTIITYLSKDSPELVIKHFEGYAEIAKQSMLTFRRPDRPIQELPFLLENIDNADARIRQLAIRQLGELANPVTSWSVLSESLFIFDIMDQRDDWLEKNRENRTRIVEALIQAFDSEPEELIRK